MFNASHSRVELSHVHVIEFLELILLGHTVGDNCSYPRFGDLFPHIPNSPDLLYWDVLSLGRCLCLCPLSIRLSHDRGCTCEDTAKTLRCSSKYSIIGAK